MDMEFPAVEMYKKPSHTIWHQHFQAHHLKQLKTNKISGPKTVLKEKKPKLGSLFMYLDLNIQSGL